MNQKPYLAKLEKGVSLVVLWSGTAGLVLGGIFGLVWVLAYSLILGPSSYEYWPIVSDLINVVVVSLYILAGAFICMIVGVFLGLVFAVVCTLGTKIRLFPQPNTLQYKLLTLSFALILVIVTLYLWWSYVIGVGTIGYQSLSFNNRTVGLILLPSLVLLPGPFYVAWRWCKWYEDENTGEKENV